MSIQERLDKVKTKFKETSLEKYLESIIGTIGAGPLFVQ